MSHLIFLSISCLWLWGRHQFASSVFYFPLLFALFVFCICPQSKTSMACHRHFFLQEPIFLKSLINWDLDASQMWGYSLNPLLVLLRLIFLMLFMQSRAPLIFFTFCLRLSFKSCSDRIAFNFGIWTIFLEDQFVHDMV